MRRKVVTRWYFERDDCLSLRKFMKDNDLTFGKLAQSLRISRQYFYLVYNSRMPVSEKIKKGLERIGFRRNEDEIDK